MRITTPLAIALAISLSGCISFGAKPPKQLLTLTAAQTLPPGAARTVSPGDAITVLWPGVPAELATNRVP
ncbi:MAG TPA: ABC transporter, partial [Sphingomonas sp.]|nr:ABC transporter [Sphingomonas sp.]